MDYYVDPIHAAPVNLSVHQCIKTEIMFIATKSDQWKELRTMNYAVM